MPDPAATAEWRRLARKRLLAARAAMSGEEVASRSEALAGNLKRLFAFVRSGTLGAYWPYKGEFDPTQVLAHLHENGRSLALPRVIARSAPLAFFAWKPGDALAKGAYGIPEPVSQVQVMPDVLIIPLVGFDSNAYRLGYGGGYYDRTLRAALPSALRIGVTFEAGKLASIRPLPFDEPMDLIVTESSIYGSTVSGLAALSSARLPVELPRVVARAKDRSGPLPA